MVDLIRDHQGEETDMGTDVDELTSMMSGRKKRISR